MKCSRSSAGVSSHPVKCSGALPALRTVSSRTYSSGASAHPGAAPSSTSTRSHATLSGSSLSLGTGAPVSTGISTGPVHTSFETKRSVPEGVSSGPYGAYSTSRVASVPNGMAQGSGGRAAR